MAIVVFVAVPSFRELARHFPAPAVVGAGLCVAMFVVAYVALGDNRFSTPARRLVRRRVVIASSLVVLTVVGAGVFHYRDTHRSSDLDPTASLAMREPIEAVRAGDAMYSVRLPANVPVSPGPGWLLLNGPFTLLGAYAFLVPAYLAVAVLILRNASRDPSDASLILLIFALSPAAWRLISEGNDLVALSAVMVVLVVLMHRFVSTTPRASAFALVVGAIATARIVYLGLPCLLGVLLATRSRWAGFVLAASGLATAATFHLVFAAGVDPYPPAHLFDRASDKGSTLVMTIGVICSAIAAIAALRRLSSSLASWLVVFAVCFATPHLFVGLSELSGGGYSFVGWEGANYLLVGALPVLAASFVQASTHRELS